MKTKDKETYIQSIRKSYRLVCEAKTNLLLLQSAFIDEGIDMDDSFEDIDDILLQSKRCIDELAQSVEKLETED